MKKSSARYQLTGVNGEQAMYPWKIKIHHISICIMQEGAIYHVTN